MPPHFRARALSSFVLVIGTLGCGAYGTGYAIGAAAAKPIVLSDASKDLDCPQSDVRVEEQLGGRWMAIGCGRKAMYNAKCDGVSCEVVPDGAAVPWRDKPTDDPLWRH